MKLRDDGFFGGLAGFYDIALIQSFKCEVTTKALLIPSLCSWLFSLSPSPSMCRISLLPRYQYVCSVHCRCLTQHLSHRVMRQCRALRRWKNPPHTATHMHAAGNVSGAFI